jgi:hypothetical protein
MLHVSTLWNHHQARISKKGRNQLPWITISDLYLTTSFSTSTTTTTTTATTTIKINLTHLNYIIQKFLCTVVLQWPRVIPFKIIQGGSNMTGTNCDLFTHNQSWSYLNHLVYSKCLIKDYNKIDINFCTFYFINSLNFLCVLIIFVLLYV